MSGVSEAHLITLEGAIESRDDDEVSAVAPVRRSFARLRTENAAKEIDPIDPPTVPRRPSRRAHE